MNKECLLFEISPDGSGTQLAGRRSIADSRNMV